MRRATTAKNRGLSNGIRGRGRAFRAAAIIGAKRAPPEALNALKGARGTTRSRGAIIQVARARVRNVHGRTREVDRGGPTCVLLMFVTMYIYRVKQGDAAISLARLELVGELRACVRVRGRHESR